MARRIILSPAGLQISKPGYDAAVASPENMALYPGMEPMRPAYSGTVTFGGAGSQDFSIPNPTGAIPYVVLRGSDGVQANRGTYCAEMWEPYTICRVRNIDGRARTVRFFVLI